MNTARIAQLKQFLKEEPEDPFLKYALAMEYLDTEPSKSRELFESLLENHPDYIGTYYHAAALYAEMDQRELAEKTYQTGIEKAKALNEAHALKELKTAYLNFQFED